MLALLIVFAASHTSSRACELCERLRTTSAICSSMRSRWRASAVCSCACVTRRWVTRPMIALTTMKIRPARYWLFG